MCVVASLTQLSTTLTGTWILTWPFPAQILRGRRSSAIAVRLQLYGQELTLLNAQLANGTSSECNADVRSIAEELLPAMIPEDADTDSDADVGSPFMLQAESPLVWFGDLNYRLEPVARSDIEAKLSKPDLAALYDADPLRTERANCRVFVGFKETEPLTFSPTWRYDLTTGAYDYGQGKAETLPAWRSRILWYGRRVQPFTQTAAHPLGYVTVSPSGFVRG
jgi:hypothetical protein